MTHDIEKLKQDIVSWLNDENRVWPEWTDACVSRNVSLISGEIDWYDIELLIDSDDYDHGFTFCPYGEGSELHALQAAQLIGLDLSKYRCS